MRNIFFSVGLMALLSIALFGQDKICLRNSKILLDKTKGSIHITLDRSGKEDVLLRLENNSPWTIFITTEILTSAEQAKYKMVLCSGETTVSLPNGFEVMPRYQIAQDPPPEMSIGPRPKDVYIYPLSYPDVGGQDTPILSGRSVTFVVKRELLLSPRRVYVSFEYEWEWQDHGPYLEEPEHRVYFNASTYGLDRQR